jgi:outer membrane protein
LDNLEAFPIIAASSEVIFRAKTRDGVKRTMSKFLHAAALSLLATGVISCNVGDPAPFDPRSMGQGERLASRDARTYPMHPLPTTLESTYLDENGNRNSTPPATGPSLGTEPQVRMTLQEIVQRAMANSADIKVAAYEPAIDQSRVVEAEARFDPTFFAQTQVQRIDKESDFSVAGASGAGTGNTNGFVQKETDYTASFGIRQDLESGGSIEFRNQTQITQNDLLANNGSGTLTPNTAFGHNPALENEFVVEISQPLLRDFGNEINRARITINRYNQRISLLEFRKQVETTAAELEKTYWDLVEAERDVKVQEDLVSETIDTAQRLIKRRGTDVTRVQISQTEAKLESRRATLIELKSQVKDFSDLIKRDMNDPEFPVSGPIIILPASAPLEEQVHFDPQEVTDTALANRFELGEQQLRVDSATVALAVGKNNLLPQLNAAGSVSLQGLSGSYAGILDDQLNGDYISWSFGLEYEIPIGNRAARATYQRALMQRAQAIDSYQQEIGTVQLDCTKSMRAVQTAWDALGANRMSVFAAEKSLQGVEEREAAGDALTPEFVQLKLDQQDTLAESRKEESRAVATYNEAISQLEQSKGTLLQYNNVIMQEDMIPYERKWLPKK